MKRRILAGLLSFVLVFNVFSLVIFAEESASAVSDTAQTDYLLAEIEKNMTNESTGESSFDVSRYPKSENGSPLVIGGYESGIFDDLDAALYVYVYNPSEKELEKLTLQFFASLYKNDEEIHKDFLYAKPQVDIVGATVGEYNNRFYKIRVDLSEYSSKYDLKECSQHIFTLKTTIFYYKNEAKYVRIQNDIDFSFGIDNTNKKLICQMDNHETKVLDVGMTCYRHGSVDADLYTVNQINTAYFSVPDRYADYFENIYSITSRYKKKTTVPIMWGDFPTNYLDYFYCSIENGTSTTNGHSIKAETGVYKESFYESDIEKCYSFDDVIIFDLYGADASYILSRAYLQGKFEIWQNDGSNKTLFVNSEFCSTDRTIDQSFDSLTYDTQADFWKRVEDYGLLSALLNHWVSGEFSIDEDLYDIPYIVLCDDEVRLDLKNLPKESFCYKYFIDEGDYEDFKAYLNSHDNVYLYRFDVSDHWSDTLIAGGTSGGVFYQSQNLTRTFGICQTAYYDDFQVVDLTFKNSDSYLSVAVTSDPQDFIGPGTVVKGDPDDDEFGVWWDKLMKELDKMWATVKRFMTAIAIIVVVILVVTVVGHFTGLISNIKNIFKNSQKK